MRSATLKTTLIAIAAALCVRGVIASDPADLSDWSDFDGDDDADYAGDDRREQLLHVVRRTGGRG